MRLAYLVTSILLVAIVPTVTTAQQIEAANPFFLADAIHRAHLIAVGTFKVSWFYPWVDGWHYRGALKIEKVLKGSRKAEPPIEFYWKEAFGSNSLVCDRMSWIDNQRAIWLLTHKDGVWRLSGTAGTFCGWDLPMSLQGAVEKANRENSSSGAVH